MSVKLFFAGLEPPSPLKKVKIMGVRGDVVKSTSSNFSKIVSNNRSYIILAKGNDILGMYGVTDKKKH